MLQALAQLTHLVVSRYGELGSRVFKLVASVWSTFVDQQSYTDGSLNDHLDGVIAIYT